MKCAEIRVAEEGQVGRGGLETAASSALLRELATDGKKTRHLHGSERPSWAAEGSSSKNRILGKKKTAPQINV